MTEGHTITGAGGSYDSADLVLAALHDHHLVIHHAEIQKLTLAVQWAIMHPAESPAHAATADGSEGLVGHRHRAERAEPSIGRDHDGPASSSRTRGTTSVP